MAELTLGELTAEAAELAAQRGWADKTLEQRALYLTSEVGEVAQEVVRLAWAQGEEAARVREDLGAELYDVLWNVCDLARLAGIDLAEVAQAKHAHNLVREWT